MLNKKINKITAIFAMFCMFIMFFSMVHAENITSGIKSLTLTGSEVTVKGVSRVFDNSEFLIMVLRPGYTIDALTQENFNDALAESFQMHSDTFDGNYVITLKMKDNDVAGDYTLYIGEQDFENVSFKTFYYASKESRIDLIDKMRLSGSFGGVKAILEEKGNLKMLGVSGLLIDEYSALSGKDYVCQKTYSKGLTTGGDVEKTLKEVFNEAVISEIFCEASDTDTLIKLLTTYNDKINVDLSAETGLNSLSAEGKKFVLNYMTSLNSYDGFESITASFNESYVVSMVNEITWGGLSALFEKYDKVFNFAKYDAYKALSDTAVIDKKIANKKYPNLLELRKAFESAMTDTGGVSGSGISGGGGVVTRPVDKTPSIAIPEITDDIKNPDLFSDITSVPWAKESIEALYIKGIVSGKKENIFAPDDNVTREEFLKMLISALKMDDLSATCEYSDVTLEDWYYIYIASATKKGIALGVGNGEFGIGKYITRQDMFCMIDRALKAAGRGIKKINQSENFADDYLIESYAKEAVYAMQMAGIIDGSDGKINPAGNATRAEAAKVIYGILNAPYDEIAAEVPDVSYAEDSGESGGGDIQKPIDPDEIWWE